MRYRPTFVQIRVFIFCALTSLLVKPLAASHLTWEKTAVEIHAAPLQERVDAVFRFTNTGSSRIMIVSAAASCGCTVPQIAKVVYAPGEQGELHALFTPDERVGLRQEEIMVLTDEPGESPQVLVLRVDVPKLYDVSPYFLIWHSDEAAAPKKIKIHFLDPKLFHPVSLNAKDARVAATIEKDPSAAGDYVVTMQPHSTATALDTMVSLILETASGAKRTISLYAVVRVAPSPSPQ